MAPLHSVLHASLGVNHMAIGELAFVDLVHSQGQFGVDISVSFLHELRHLEQSVQDTG